MEDTIFSPMVIDAIGEIMNISLGSSATAASNMLDHRVDITTPRVSVVNAEDFALGKIEPAVGVEIKYVCGLEGSNIMLLKRSDVKAIVDILLGTETPDEEFELNELSISAVCEVMNQMMGSSATALSDLLGRMVNISTPESFELDDLDKVKEEHFPVTRGPVVVVRFNLTIENVLDSEFMNVMSIELAQELVAGFGLDEPAAEPEPAPTPAPAPAGGGAVMSQEEIEKMMAGGAAAAPAAPAPGVPATPPAMPQAVPSGMPEMPGYPGYPTYPYPYPPYPMYPPQAPAAPPDPKVVNAQPNRLKELSSETQLNQEQRDNLDLILSVSLEVAVEIGRTRRKIQDILSFSKGSLVVLDKLAGDQVDLLVNGQCVAKGDVVVIDDNFGIRITEILQKPDINVLTQG
ncbi:flagellar motor switch phosphatase FliY [Oscillospiraceae bacterium 50-58]